MKKNQEIVMEQFKLSETAVLLLKSGLEPIDSKYSFIECKYMINKNREINIIFSCDRNLIPSNFLYELILKKGYEVFSIAGSVKKLNKLTQYYHMTFQPDVFNIENLSNISNNQLEIN